MSFTAPITCLDGVFCRRLVSALPRSPAAGADTPAQQTPCALLSAGVHTWLLRAGVHPEGVCAALRNRAQGEGDLR